MARDELASEAYFSEKIVEHEEYISEDRADMDGEIRERGLDASGLAVSLVSDQLRTASMAYSRGDALPEVAARVGQALTDAGYLHRILEATPGSKGDRDLSYLLVFQRLWYAALFCPGTDAGRNAVRDLELLGKSDPLLDAFAAFVTGEPIDTDQPVEKLRHPALYGDLWQAMQLRQDGSAPLKRYLEGWYKMYENKDGAGTLGIGGHVKMIRYQGYWCWEAAAVCVMLGIDDDSFANHPYYPKDLADWARQR